MSEYPSFFKGAIQKMPFWHSNWQIWWYLLLSLFHLTYSALWKNSLPLAIFLFCCFTTWYLNEFWFYVMYLHKNTPNCSWEIKIQLVFNNSKKLKTEKWCVQCIHPLCIEAQSLTFRSHIISSVNPLVANLSVTWS